MSVLNKKPYAKKVIKSDIGEKFMVKVKCDMVYLQATELKDQPREYIEVDE